MEVTLLREPWRFSFKCHKDSFLEKKPLFVYDPKPTLSLLQRDIQARRGTSNNAAINIKACLDLQVVRLNNLTIEFIALVVHFICL